MCVSKWVEVVREENVLNTRCTTSRIRFRYMKQDVLHTRRRAILRPTLRATYITVVQSTVIVVVVLFLLGVFSNPKRVNLQILPVKIHESEETDDNDVGSDIIMGFASGYKLRDVSFFIESGLRCTKAHFILFVNSLDDMLGEITHHPRVVFVPILDMGAFHSNPVIQRFYVYDAWLKGFNQSAVGFHLRRILLTDVRDVFFQGDVFEPMTAPGIHVFDEGILLRDEPNYNHGWIRDCQLGGDNVLVRLFDRPIYNGGIIGATNMDLMLAFLKDMFKGLDVGCNDQGWLNVLVSTPSVRSVAIHAHNLTNTGDSWVANCLIHVSDKHTAPVLIDAGERLVNPQGTRVYALIHQGDRYQEVWALRTLQNRSIVTTPLMPLRPFYDFAY